ncbi:MAG: hypothetical protein ACERKD_00730 [Prolixibacteraceae bacterium]
MKNKLERIPEQVRTMIFPEAALQSSNNQGELMPFWLKQPADINNYEDIKQMKYPPFKNYL